MNEWKRLHCELCEYNTIPNGRLKGHINEVHKSVTSVNTKQKSQATINFI